MARLARHGVAGRISKLGIEPLKRLLLDLGAGMPINEALERHTGGLSAFEAGFETFAKGRAEKFGNVKAWVGSKVKVWAVTDEPVKGGSVQLMVGPQKFGPPIPLQIERPEQSDAKCVHRLALLEGMVGIRVGVSRLALASR